MSLGVYFFFFTVIFSLSLLLIFLLYSVAFVATTFPREEIPAVMDGVDALL